MDCSSARAQEEVCCCRKCPLNTTGTASPFWSRLAEKLGCRWMPGGQEPQSKRLRRRCLAMLDAEVNSTTTAAIDAASISNELRSFVQKIENREADLTSFVYFSNLLLIQLDPVANVYRLESKNDHASRGSCRGSDDHDLAHSFVRHVCRVNFWTIGPFDHA